MGTTALCQSHFQIKFLANIEISESNVFRSRSTTFFFFLSFFPSFFFRNVAKSRAGQYRTDAANRIARRTIKYYVGALKM